MIRETQGREEKGEGRQETRMEGRDCKGEGRNLDSQGKVRRREEVPKEWERVGREEIGIGKKLGKQRGKEVKR